MNQHSKDTIFIRQETTDTTVELSNFLNILGSDVRLKILGLIRSKPMDIELISSHLYRIYGKVSSRENTKKHIDRLLSVGLVRKQPGIRDNRAVINYMVVPGSIEITLRTLNKTMKLDLDLELSGRIADVRNRISEEFSGSFAIVKVLGGIDDGKEFQLKEPRIRIGRIDQENKDKYDPENDIVLSDQYGAITRVWKPHAVLILDQGQWNIEHLEGKNPTYLWHRELGKKKRYKLRHGDLIGLAKGVKGVRLVFLHQNSNEDQTN